MVTLHPEKSVISQPHQTLWFQVLWGQVSPHPSGKVLVLVFDGFTVPVGEYFKCHWPQVPPHSLSGKGCPWVLADANQHGKPTSAHLCPCPSDSSTQGRPGHLTSLIASTTFGHHSSCCRKSFLKNPNHISHPDFQLLLNFYASLGRKGSKQKEHLGLCDFTDKSSLWDMHHSLPFLRALGNLGER